MSSIENQDQIQAFCAGRANPSRCERVRVGGSDGGVDDMKAFRLENRIKSLAERAIIIMDQEAQGLFSLRKFPNQLPGLLSNPDLIGIGGDTGKMNATRSQFDEEEHIECLKKGCFYCEKITRQDLFFVVGHEMTPSNGPISDRCRENTITTEYISNRCQGNCEAQLEEFTQNLAVTHAGILLSDLDD